MKKIYEEVTLADHFLHLYGPSFISKDNLNNNNAGTAERKMGIVENNGAMYSKLNSENMLDLEMASNDSTTGTPRAPLKRKKTAETQQDPERVSLKRALKNDPVKKLHQVYDKNLVNAHHRDVNLHLKRRRESALWLKEKIITIKYASHPLMITEAYY